MNQRTIQDYINMFLRCKTQEPQRKKTDILDYTKKFKNFHMAKIIMGKTKN